MNAADLVFLALRGATALLCLVAARGALRRACLPGQPRPRRWRARFGAAVLLALGVFALEDGLGEALGRPGEPLRWRSWVWVILDLSIPAQVLAVLATLRQRDRLEAELAQAARRDPLTGLPNRTGFTEAASAALAAVARDGRPVVGAMLDIDHFKAINDGWGHAAGDVVLREVATAMRGALRPGDVLARVGGEEFALLLLGVDTEAARPLLERLRAAAAMVPHPGAPERSVTLSAGLAPVQGLGLAALESGLRSADGALYAAKAAGRNRVVLAG
ncbi:GGDEF domain-containing protein [Cyanobium sp. N5-Cardenillas]|uniref:GGDEF domain-containing protein n=1 Tax=Cyanobium sp. N5-Cardenillas TaxID=2823720 RepID=UPI0020CF15A7|nr:GGDEF domain-containing protein [Cyanobium sp. N5-Cardenillas]MCP9787040.1 GGDEF domain-containing protein [Cyanobium sp. N5-Cardenillas]